MRRLLGRGGSRQVRRGVDTCSQPARAPVVINRRVRPMNSNTTTAAGHTCNLRSGPGRSAGRSGRSPGNGSSGRWRVCGWNSLCAAPGGPARPKISDVPFSCPVHNCRHARHPHRRRCRSGPKRDFLHVCLDGVAVRRGTAPSRHGQPRVEGGTIGRNSHLCPARASVGAAAMGRADGGAFAAGIHFARAGRPRKAENQ